jgi:hypothetical protein
MKPPKKKPPVLPEPDPELDVQSSWNRPAELERNSRKESDAAIKRRKESEEIVKEDKSEPK